MIKIAYSVWEWIPDRALYNAYERGRLLGYRLETVKEVDPVKAEWMTKQDWIKLDDERLVGLKGLTEEEMRSIR